MGFSKTEVSTMNISAPQRYSPRTCPRASRSPCLFPKLMPVKVNVIVQNSDRVTLEGKKGKVKQPRRKERQGRNGERKRRRKQDGGAGKEGFVKGDKDGPCEGGGEVGEQ